MLCVVELLRPQESTHDLVGRHALGGERGEGRGFMGGSIGRQHGEVGDAELGDQLGRDDVPGDVCQLSLSMLVAGRRP
jgi:hypothetical protein